MRKNAPGMPGGGGEALPAASDPAPSSLEVVEAFDDFMRSFESFKDANDDRLRQIEAQVGADVVTTEKMRRINSSLDSQKAMLDQLMLKSRRTPLGAPTGNLYPGIGAGRSFNPERKAAFEAYVRRGDETRMRRLEEKALEIGSGPDGGYTVPDETEIEIGRRLAEVSPIRAIASVRQISAAVYKKPFATSGAAVGWVGEKDARPETQSPVLDELEFPAMELYAMPAATQSLLDDTAIDIDAWIAQEVETAFAEQEGAAFVSGNGTKKPTGFLNYTQVDEASWAWNSIGYLPTGVDADFPASDAPDNLIDLIFTLKAGYRQNAHFVMNRKTQAEVRKLKDSEGNYVWQPGHQPGTPPTLLGFPVAESEDMPNIASDAAAIAFGDFKRGYLIVDRIGTRVLRDPYSAKPYVLFYTTKRVGGGVQDFDAIKLLRFGTA
jgi:HK97 family phage major capsid protein